MNKQTIKFGEEGRQQLINGVKLISQAVKSTLGPGGRNVIFNTGHGTCVTKDGVTVAKNVRPTGKFEAMGADIVRQAAETTAHSAGDGTTTSTILSEAIIDEGIKKIAAGYNPISLQRGIKSAAETIVNYIKTNIAIDCELSDIEHVALVSSNWDQQLAKLISEAMVKAGKDGSVTIEQSRSDKSSVEYIDGMQIERGYLSPYFVNNPERATCEFENPLIYLSGQKITNNLQLRPILECAFNAGKGSRPILIIAPDIEHEALRTLVINKQNAILNICAIKCPGFGDAMKDQMFDLESLLGGTYMSTDLDRDHASINESDLGTCTRVTITRDTTTFIGQGSTVAQLENRKNFIKELLANTGETWYAKKLKERLAKLSNGVAIVTVGGATESELQERLDRADDAMCATRAALEAGIVPGGGATLAKIKEKKLDYEQGDESFNIGVSIVRSILTAPLEQLLKNAGVEDASTIITKIAKSKVIDFGYDIKTGQYCNLLTAGIVDPFTVLAQAITNAASVAGLLLTTNCQIVTENTE